MVNRDEAIREIQKMSKNSKTRSMSRLFARFLNFFPFFGKNSLKMNFSQSLNDMESLDFALLANNIRKNIITMVYKAKSGHPGGPLGLADIFAILHFRHLNRFPEEPFSDERDYFLLSNGHVCAVQYATMALAGFLPLDELNTFRTLGSRLQGHPSTKFLSILENSSGSLGQGLSNASGLALGLKQQNKKNYVFVCLSDGECQEGMVWEAAMAAAHYKNSRLIAFVDWNGVQIDGFVKNIMDIKNLQAKFDSFGWFTKKVNGHDYKAIDQAFQWAKEKKGDKPRIILFETTLGKDVDFMENNPSWHGVPPKQEEHDKALAQLASQEKEILQRLEAFL